MPAFRAAVARNKASEFDVHPTADGTVCVIHDATWDRTTPYTGRVAETSQAKVDDIRTDGGNVIPSFRQLMTLVSQVIGSPFLIDWKMADPWPDVAYETVRSRILEVGAENKTFLFSSDLVEIANIQARMPEVRISYRPVNEPYSLEETLGMGVEAIQPNWTTITASQVADYQNAGLRVIMQDQDIDTKANLQSVLDMAPNYVLIDSAKWDSWTS